jgi:uncharacterized protein
MIHYYYGEWIILGVFMLISLAVSSQLKSKFKKYSQTPFRIGLTGKEIAEKMLRDHGIRDVSVVSVAGELSDHYNPINKTINLSPAVYSQATVSAAAVAAHECGHAVQHATAYSFLKMRSALVPVVNISSHLVQWVILGGVLLMNVFPALLFIGIGLFALTTLFSIITLPVEYDASRRALVWLNNAGITSGEEQAQAKDALKWAARTYLVAALGSLATLIYYILIFTGSSSDD